MSEVKFVRSIGPADKGMFVFWKSMSSTGTKSAKEASEKKTARILNSMFRDAYPQ